MPDDFTLARWRGQARRLWWIGGLAVIVLVVGIYFLKPVVGPPRDLTLTGDVSSGNYLILLSGCAACHTEHKPGMSGARLAGGDPIKTGFGTFYPPNITPDKETGIGSWTLGQFSDALSNGVGPMGNLYPVFPYNDLSLMSDQEVADLYAAIMASPAVARRAPPNEVIFPFNIRLLVSGWKNLFFSPHRYRPAPGQSEEWNRGAYLANGLAHCVACHSPTNLMGAVQRGEEFQGNPAGGAGGNAPALTAAALIGDGFDLTSLAQMLKTGDTPDAGRVGKEMALVISDETSQWSDSDRQAIALYLLARSANVPAP